MWVTKLLISQVKKRIFCPKLAFLVNFGQAMQAYSVPCWWLVVVARGLYLARHLFTLSLLHFHYHYQVCCVRRDNDQRKEKPPTSGKSEDEDLASHEEKEDVSNNDDEDGIDEKL